MALADIKTMTETEIEEWVTANGEQKFRAKQVYGWLIKGALSFDEMKNIPNALKTKLADNFFIPTVTAERKLVSKIDGTVKYLYKLYDGEYIESVVMKYNHGYSVCISTQVGCKMGCSFCASGLEGLKRSLTASEMIAQVEYAARDNSIRVSNVVLMGMGEPMDNLDNVIRFIHLAGDENGLSIGQRHISVSTSGVVSGIKRLMDEHLQITLSVSLHAPNDKIRSSIMKVNKRWGVDELLECCQEYINETGRRISFEYALIKDVNDSDSCAKELAKKLHGMICHVNLIPANPVKENNYEMPNKKGIEHFEHLLLSLGINTTVRRTLGADINASCGQLRRNKMKGEDINENCEQN